MHSRTIAGLIVILASAAAADEPLYRYEGDVLPSAAGWLIYDACEIYCVESIENGRFVLRWGELGNLTNYNHVVARTPDNTPSSLWIEWRFRSNIPIPRFADDCDAFFVVNYRELFDVMFLFGDAIVSFSGDDWLLGFALDEFHTYRFESPNGVNYWFSVDGLVFYTHVGDYPDDPYSSIQFGGGGGCGETRPPEPRNEWDYIRYGTISYGEQIVSSDPPAGFVDARAYVLLDRFTVTFDQPNYVYIDEITVETTSLSSPLDNGGGVGAPIVIPAVIATRRLDNGPPETVEIVLDRAIPHNAMTRFTFNDGVAVQTVEFTFAPGDTDGDADLSDFAAFQNCFGVFPVAGRCLPLDFNADSAVDLLDFAAFQAIYCIP